MIASEVVIAYLLSQPSITDLVGTRIAARHRYGDVSSPWAKDQAGIMVKLDGGDADNAMPFQGARLQVRIYAPSLYEALQVWDATVSVLRSIDREPVAVTGGTAVLHSLNQETLPNSLWDADIDMDFVLVFWRAYVSETPAQIKEVGDE